MRYTNPRLLTYSVGGAFECFSDVKSFRLTDCTLTLYRRGSRRGLHVSQAARMRQYAQYKDISEIVGYCLFVLVPGGQLSI